MTSTRSLPFQAGVLEDQDLQDMGVSSDKDRNTILQAAQQLPCRVKDIATQQQHQQQQQDHEEQTKECEAADEVGILPAPTARLQGPSIY